MNDWISFFAQHDMFTKLGIAFLFGCVLGLERSLKRKHASLKTAIVLTVTACMVTLVSIESAQLFSSPYDKPMDPLRLAAQLISGISFIGAGIILTKNNDAVSGLTTAAMMWASVGFGIAIGAGFYLEAVVAILFILFGVEVLPLLVRYLGPKRLQEKLVKIKLRVEAESVKSILRDLKGEKMEIEKVKIKDAEDMPRLEIMVLVPPKLLVTDMYERIKEIRGVTHVEIERV